MSDDTARLLAQLGLPEKMTEPDDVHELTDGVRIPLAGIHFRVDHVLGHTKGSGPFRTPYAPDNDVEELVFSGDVLFAGSIGSTDLPGGSPADMLESLDEGRSPAGLGGRAAWPRSADHDRPGTGDQPLSETRFLDIGGQEQSVSRPRPLSGFPEYIPEGRIVEQHFLDMHPGDVRAARVRVDRDPVGRADRAAVRAGRDADKEIYAVSRLPAATTPRPGSDCISISPCRSPGTCWRTPVG